MMQLSRMLSFGHFLPFFAILSVSRQVSFLKMQTASSPAKPFQDHSARLHSPRSIETFLGTGHPFEIVVDGKHCRRSGLSFGMFGQA